MDLELPNTLHSTRDLLMRSLVMHPEQAPAMPAGLAFDLTTCFAPREIKTPVVAPVSWFEKVRGFLSTPAFGAAAAAVVILGVAIPMVSGPVGTRTETFRGGEKAQATDSVRIVFIGQNPEALSLVKASGDFEASAISSVESSAASDLVTGPRVLVDFTAGTLVAIDRDGSTVHRMDLPAGTSEVADAIASALSHFK